MDARLCDFYVHSCFLFLLRMVITPRDIVDGDQAPVGPVPRPALVTAANVPDILVGVPQVVAADLALVAALNKHAAAARLVAPAVTRQPVATKDPAKSVKLYKKQSGRYLSTHNVAYVRLSFRVSVLTAWSHHLSRSGVVHMPEPLQSNVPSRGSGANTFVLGP